MKRKKNYLCLVDSDVNTNIPMLWRLYVTDGRYALRYNVYKLHRIMEINYMLATLRITYDR